MKKFYVGIFSFFTILFSGNAFGQVVITSVTSCTAYTLTATLTGLTPINSGLYSDDSYSGVINIGFTFNFYGTPYTQLIIGENGQLTFTTSLAGGYDPWPISAALLGNSSAYNTVCAPWCDIESMGPPADPIMYSVQGTAPNRTFAATWCGDHMFSCTAQWTTTQIIIYETTGVVEAHIGHKTVCAGWNGGYAIVGVQNASGSSATTAPGRDYPSVWTATNEAWRFTPAGTTSYTCSSIPYAPIPYASSTIYWYNSTTGAYLGSGTTFVVDPTTTTTYEAAALGCLDTSKGFITLGPPSGGAVGTIVSTTGATSMCLGSGITLTDATTGGVWSSSNTAVATVGAAGGVSSVSGGTTIISYTNGPCTTTMIVTVNTAPPIGGTTSVCAGGTTTLNDVVGGGTWTSGSPGIATIGAGTGVVMGVSAGISIITYTTPAGCTTTTPVTVILLTPTAGQRVCQGSTVTFTNSTPGGTWTSTTPTVATIGAASGIATGVSGGVANLTYTTAGGCFTATTVTVNPTSPIGGLLSMCQYFTTTLNDALTGGTWSSGAPGIATVNATGVVNGLTGGNATISYTSPSGCVMTANVVVNPKPAPPVPDAPFSFCQFLPASVSATGTNILWYGPGVTAGSSFPPAVSSSLPGSTTYYLTQTTSFGCVSDSATDIVTIIPQPAAPITHDTVYCQNYNGFILPLNFEVDSAAGSVLDWYTGSLSPLPGAPVPPVNAATYPAGTTWNVAQTVNTCESPTAPITVTIIPTPEFALVYRNWVCQHDSIMLSYTLDPGSVLVGQQYYWTLPFGTSVADGTNATQGSVYVKFDSTNVNYYTGTLTIGNLAGQCSTIDTFSVKVIPLPTAQSYSNPNVCLGDTVSLSLSAQASDAATFYWFIDGTPMPASTAINIIAASSNSGGPFSISWNTIGDHIITVQTSTEQGCTSLPVNDTVDVHPLPDATFDVNPKTNNTLCLEDSILFVAHDLDVNCSYLWQPEPCFNNNNKPNIWGKVEQGRTNIMLTVTDPYGCKATSAQQLTPDACCTVLFPNAFTPNGDLRDDVFRPIFSGYHNFHSFTVVNRWGQVVYEGANSTCSWDGNYNGVPQDMGVYYYYLKYDCGGKTFEQKGDVTLIR